MAMAVWILVPDKLDNEANDKGPRFGVFATTVVAFFIAEMGDKTQLLAFLLAARFRKPVPIVLGILVATVLNHVATDIAKVGEGFQPFTAAEVAAVRAADSGLSAQQVAQLHATLLGK